MKVAHIVGIALSLTITAGCCTLGRPLSSEEVRTDLTGGTCRPLDYPDPVGEASNFVTFECVTADAVDLVHIHDGSRHCPALYVRVPLAEATRFLTQHGGHHHRTPVAPREQDL